MSWEANSKLSKIMDSAFTVYSKIRYVWRGKLWDVPKEELNFLDDAAEASRQVTIDIHRELGLDMALLLHDEVIPYHIGLALLNHATVGRISTNKTDWCEIGINQYDVTWNQERLYPLLKIRKALNETGYNALYKWIEDNMEETDDERSWLREFTFRRDDSDDGGETDVRSPSP